MLARLHFGQWNSLLAREDLREQFQYFPVQHCVIGQNVRAMQIRSGAEHIRAQAPGFANQQEARGHIPGMQAELPEEIQPPAGHIGQIDGGTSRNVIAGKVTIRGTARTLDAAAAQQVEASFRRILQGLIPSLRLDYELNWMRQTPVLKNDAQVLAVVLGAARDVLGADRVVEMGPPSMGSEDFAWFAERVPAAHLRIGSQIDGLNTQIHLANYDCNELAIPTGVRVIARAVLDLLSQYRK